MKKYFWKLILPITFQQFMLALVSASDALMLGKMNQDFLSAVSLAGQVAFVFNLFIAALTIGTNMFAAQYWGIQDRDSVEKVMGFAMRTTVCIAGVFCIAASFFSGILMRAFTNDPRLVEMGVLYLRAVGTSYVLSGITQIYLCIMKNSEQAGKSMLISSCTVVLNIVLNAVLIFGWGMIPSMGIVGAALATVIANAAGVIWSVLESYRCGGLRLRRKYTNFHITELERRFWKYVLPILANEILWGGGFTMYSVIMGHMGTDAVAANSIANITKNLLICFCMGLGSSGSIIVGNKLGAGELEEAKKSGAYLCRLSIISGIVTGLLLLAITPAILHFSNISEEAREYLKWMLVISSYYLAGKSVNGMTVGGIFCAGGDSRFGMICDGITLWCITVPMGATAAFVFHAPVLAVYFLLNLDEIVKLPVVCRHYKKYNWIKNLTKTESGEKQESPGVKPVEN